MSPPVLRPGIERTVWDTGHARRHELLDGAYVVSPEASPRHQRAAFALGRALLPGVADRADLELFPIPGDIVLGSRTVVEPDLFVVPRPASPDGQWRDVGRPVLVARSTGFSTSTPGWWNDGGRKTTGRKSCETG